jgi:hypothetical protein
MRRTVLPRVLSYTRVTTRIVLRSKRPAEPHFPTAKNMYRAILNAFVLNCELFTDWYHADLDNNLFHPVALICIDVLLKYN